MKGIRKLLFGLILMTLFGVGFKVDVKAAKPQFYKLNNYLPNLICSLKDLKQTDFPPSGDEDEYLLGIMIKNKTDPTEDSMLFKQLSLGTTIDGDPYYYFGSDDPEIWHSNEDIDASFLASEINEFIGRSQNEIGDTKFVKVVPVWIRVEDNMVTTGTEAIIADRITLTAKYAKPSVNTTTKSIDYDDPSKFPPGANKVQFSVTGGSYYSVDSSETLIAVPYDPDNKKLFILKGGGTNSAIHCP